MERALSEGALRRAYKVAPSIHRTSLKDCPKLVITRRSSQISVAFPNVALLA
jgi:hypothetical protein